MFWGVVVLLILLGTLLIVIIFALSKYVQLSQIQTAIEHAWFDYGKCTGKTDSTDCSLHVKALPSLSTNPGNAFDRVTARKLADYVARVELAQEPIPTDENHLLLDRYVPPTGPAFGAAWRDKTNGVLVLAFRATVTHTEIQDDLMASQIDFDTGHFVSEPVPTSADFSVAGEGPYVHSGFFRVLERYKNAVFETLSTHKPRVLYITGHSLGGAMATLLTVSVAEAIDEGVTSVSSIQSLVGYVFGTPRVGNATFNTKMQNPRITAFWRVVNKADNIQDLPMYVTPNFRKPRERVLFYEHAGSAYEYFENWGTWKTNHFLPNYMYHLND